MSWSRVRSSDKTGPEVGRFGTGLDCWLCLLCTMGSTWRLFDQSCNERNHDWWISEESQWRSNIGSWVILLARWIGRRARAKGVVLGLGRKVEGTGRKGNMSHLFSFPSFSSKAFTVCSRCWLSSNRLVVWECFVPPHRELCLMQDGLYMDGWVIRKAYAVSSASSSTHWEQCLFQRIGVRIKWVNICIAVRTVPRTMPYNYNFYDNELALSNGIFLILTILEISIHLRYQQIE